MSDRVLVMNSGRIVAGELHARSTEEQILARGGRLHGHDPGSGRRGAGRLMSIAVSPPGRPTAPREPTGCSAAAPDLRPGDRHPCGVYVALFAVVGDRATHAVLVRRQHGADGADLRRATAYVAVAADCRAWLVGSIDLTVATSTCPWERSSAVRRDACAGTLATKAVIPIWHRLERSAGWSAS